MPSFQEFLTRGTIGGVQLGMLPEVIERTFGPAEDRSVQRHPTETFKYGCVELTFKDVPQTTDKRLVGVAIYFDRADGRLPHGTRFDDWMPEATTTEAEFRQFLENASLEVHSHVDGQYRSLILDTGARIVFDERRLHSVHYRRVDKAPPRRQMSVSLPEGTLTRLHEQARREQISVQQLVERMLSATA